MSTKTTNGVAWLQKIDNGILVHYYVPVRHRRPMRQGFPRFTDREPWQEEPEQEDIVSEDKIVERYSTTIKTVFCPSFDEVCDVIEIALQAAGTIEEYRQSGKLNPGYTFP